MKNSGILFLSNVDSAKCYAAFIVLGIAKRRLEARDLISLSDPVRFQRPKCASRAYICTLQMHIYVSSAA
jgi:hypothetical protein